LRHGQRAGLRQAGLKDAGCAGEGVGCAPGAIRPHQDGKADADNGQHGDQLEEGEGTAGSSKVREF